MSTTTDAAAAIRATLKAKGISSRAVSVRTDYYSMGSAIRIEVKDPTVSLAMVEDLASQHEQIQRDGWGEILGGGNRYVTARYSAAAAAAIRAAYRGVVAAAVATWATASENSLIPVAGTPFFLGRSHHGDALTLWSDHHLGSAHDVDSLAELIGTKLGGIQAGGGIHD